MKKGKVLIGLSGGVDSAVSALLLKKQGYEVIGAFMINFSGTKNKLTGDCSYLEDKKDAQKIASLLNIPLVILNYEKEYKKNVIEPMFEAYKEGKTPNPDSLCNKEIKFPMLWKHAQKIKADYISTGHYAKIKKTDSYYNLEIPKDKSKDQTYFLYNLKQSDLKHILFPISDYTKKEVRTIAKRNNFQNFNKQGTSGICFVGNINMKKFLSQKIKQKEGQVVNTEGKVIGKHKGVSFYTIGEKVRPTIGIEIEKGNLAQKRWFVVSKNIKSNLITVAPEGHSSLKSQKFYISSINWINAKPKLPINLKVRIRHLGDLNSATLEKKNGKYFCTLKKPIKGIAEGQSAVLYSKKIVLGGGEIRFK